MIISACSVETSTKGFAPCWWPANSEKQAKTLAKSLSEKLADDPRYPNAFHIIGMKDQSIGKFHRGEFYERHQTV